MTRTYARPTFLADFGEDGGDGEGGPERRVGCSPSASKIESRPLFLFADGKRYSNGGGGGGGEVMEYTLHVHGSGRGGQIGEPAKLIRRMPTEVREVRIPFESADLAIPQN